MNLEQLIVNLLLAAVVAGMVGGAAMAVTMWLICRAGWAKGNMIVAVGSMVTKSRDGALRMGGWLHLVSAIGFALIYAFAMHELGLAHLPTALYAGAGFGVIHGLCVSLALVWIVADQHPLEEFREAGLAVGLSHFAGHVAYGAAVGLVIGLMRP